MVLCCVNTVHSFTSMLNAQLSISFLCSLCHFTNHHFFIHVLLSWPSLGYQGVFVLPVFTVQCFQGWGTETWSHSAHESMSGLDPFLYSKDSVGSLEKHAC